jgi:Domain of unknown function (DUF5916)
MKRLMGLLSLALVTASPLIGEARAQAQAPSAPAAAAQRPRPQIEIPRVSQPPNLDDFVSLPSTSAASPSVAVPQDGTVPQPGSAPASAIPSSGTPARGGIDPTRGLRIDGFLQRDPGDLVPISQPTEAFLSYDATNFYVVFVCRTSDPSQLRARMSRREAMFSDDFVAVILDTFDDHQRGYEFFSNPLGIQADGITTEGQNDDMSFDTVWQSRGRLTDFGYVVSFAIPFKSLRFPSGDGRAWGIALMRAIPVNNEQAFWPGVTHTIGSFASQMADMHGLTGVSPGRNIQLIPYGTFAGARFLDGSTFDSKADARVGLDAKIVARDALTIDLTANPDFSQVESDEPQVTINQRFEVFFPEKRPFFLENAGYFQTPINLFFSRRIRDPQIGARTTGKLGGWAVGALALDDRAPGRAVDPLDPNFGDRAGNAVARVRREFGDSSVGGFVTSHDFGPTFNRVLSADTRLKVNSRIFVDGQAVVSDTDTTDGQRLRDSAYSATLNRSGRKLSYTVSYQDIGPDFHSTLGFVPRTDIRQATEFVAVRWRPKHGPVQSFGPNSFVQGTWDRSGVLQDWTVRYPFEVQFKGQSGIFVRRVESMERFDGIEFREHENLINYFTSQLRWMDFSINYLNGTRPNFYPGPGLRPFLADFRDTYLSLTFRPTSGLLLDETYIYSHLATRPESGARATIFDNHIARSRVNYQVNRELSFRAILDYNGVLANPSLVALDRTKHLTADLLMTYLVHPGTAIYVGYTDGYDNIALDPGGARTFTRRPSTSTGRQFFVKTSYLFRF